jgi:putative alpha-1,2-mannosidase
MIGENWRTEELVRSIFDKFYQPRPDGLCGNDDCGQMSAWYIFSALGFYPVNPVSGEYVLGAPQIPKATITLQNGKTFSVVATGLSGQNKYVQSVKLNGVELTGSIITYRQIQQGGKLVFEMTSTAKK